MLGVMLRSPVLRAVYVFRVELFTEVVQIASHIPPQPIDLRGHRKFLARDLIWPLF